MKTLADFTATREECADLAARFDFTDSTEPRPGYVYDGDCYIEREPDGTYYLLLHRDEYRADTVEELEPILYAWAVTECPDSLGIPDDVHAFVCALQDAMGLWFFAQALRANLGEPDPNICHMHDCCDANQCALDVVGDDVEAACALYNKARPILRGTP